VTRRGGATVSAEADPLSPSPSELRRWGLDPSWSRRVTFPDVDGGQLNWHVLDTGPGPKGTIVCVHGNPTWGYLWRDVLATLSPGWRVIAVDQTGMGYSQRPGPRHLGQRVDELVRFCRQEVDGPVVLAAHDWGAPIAGGAAAQLDVRALVLANTALALPEGVRVPPLIAAARSLSDLICRRTPLFVAGSAAMTDRAHRAALRAPYRSSTRRAAIAEFVADIPVRPGDRSSTDLARSAAALDALTCPVLILWGARDPVFHDRFLRDLRRRVPHARVERFADAGHLVCLDEPVGAVIASWLDRSLQAPNVAADAARGDETAAPPLRSVLAALDEHRDDPSLVYQGPDGSLTWSDLAERSSVAAWVLQASGLHPGDRVSLLTPPGVELLVAAMAVWKAGGACVVADASAGLVQLRRLIRGAAPSIVIGTASTLTAARLGRFAPGARLAAFASKPGVIDLHTAPREGAFVPVEFRADDEAAVVHTSGATGPAKPVRYSHGALAAQRDTLANLWDIEPGDAFTTSFGPFMLLAPVIAMGFVRPDFDVDKPSELTFDALAAAARQARVTTAWLSPAAAQTVAGTAGGRHLALGLVLLAGAPIPTSLVERIQEITEGEVRTPYGMTECLPITDGVDPLRRGPFAGTCTGRPLANCVVDIVALDDPRSPSLGDGAWGEILVSAPWMFDGYDARWSADSETSIDRDGRRFHRTGDVGYLAEGVLFQLGRAAHVLRTACGPVTSVGVEEPVAEALGRPVAAVAVGPAGTSVIALVLGGEGNLRLAPGSLASRARAASSHQIAAVLEGRLPTDRRHQSKVDRTGLAKSVSRFLAGR
jgi:acyl-coenzyme A synthetase/AMP-(fatty) acid ligase/pimeloyl-ACP methyl ester carboxylesterase